MGFFGRRDVQTEVPPLQDFEEIKANAEARKVEILRIREEGEQKKREAEIFARVFTTVKEVAGEVGEIVDGTKFQFQKIEIDDTTEIIIPLYLRSTDIFREALKKGNGESLRASLSLGEINEKIVKTLSGINIQLQSGETKVTTQMYQRMKINGVETTLGEYILNPQISKLQEMKA